ncbi:cellulose biosynthesis cyclic di-GMP-binding regulatory protein BcsB [Ensifer soli]|uniref:cellulose biosynthesis cyclic di-GMP-binding regulatory protein BcsB n=1 Tax=Ciceribacter sp. sgz301302 TaxID=3342379 RepID=UPI0035BB2CFE
MAKILSATTALALLALAATAPSSHAENLLLDAPEAAAPVAAGDSETILSTRVVTPAAKAPQAADRRLVPFEQSRPAFRLEGEDDSGRLTFNLTAAQAEAGGTLEFSYRNAVSVLPDTAVASVEVNGRAAGTFRIASPNGFTTQALPVAAELLKPGRNSVSIRARQFHRVDCSLEATYELWTEFDPAASGFHPVKPSGFATLADLLTVARTDKGRTDIRVILPQNAPAEMLNDLAPVVQTLALFLNRDDVSVTTAAMPGEGPGIDLYVAAGQAQAAFAASAGAGEMPVGLAVRASADEPDRAVVTLRAQTRGEVAKQLLAAIRGPMKEGLDTGIFATGAGAIFAEAGGRYTLADAGFETNLFTGRLSRSRVDLVMPADFYPADYATIGLRLHAATSPGLKTTSQLLVRVNGAAVSSYPFRNREGQQFDGKLIELPLRAFRPGTNRIEILAELPVAADAACSPAARNDDKPRFILLKETSIEVPKLAKIGRLPDLGAFSGNGYPYADGKPFDLFIGRSDPQSTAAAFTLLSRLALSARKPLSADIKLGKPDGGDGRDALVLSADNSFAEIGTAPKSVFPDGAAPGFDDFSAAPPVREPSAQDLMTTSAIDDGIPFAAGGEDSNALLDAFHKSTEQSADELSLVSRLRGVLSTATSRFGRWLNYDDGSARVGALKPGESLMTLAQIPSPNADATWTVIRAQSPRDLALGVDRLVDPVVWKGLAGGSAEIASADLAVAVQPATTRFISGLSDQSPGNIRRVAAAWFSDNFQFYVGLVVGLMAIFAIWLGRMVPRKGVKSEP